MQSIVAYRNGSLTLLRIMRKIALHIEIYMTVLHLLNTDPTLKTKGLLKFRQIPLSITINVPFIL